ncbi:MAG: hypothetical protein IKQ56_09015, partial [Lachnospiraceae bacterium]|nr:hypothetical protein [Lachnospiraceae bacterium]
SGRNTGNPPASGTKKPATSARPRRKKRLPSSKTAEKVTRFAEERGLDIVGEVPRSADINRWEDLGKTVIEGDPESETSKVFLKLAKKLLDQA